MARVLLAMCLPSLGPTLDETAAAEATTKEEEEEAMAMGTATEEHPL